MRSGFRNRRRYLPIHVIKKAARYMIRVFLPMIQKTRRAHHNIGSRSLIRKEIRKRGYGKAKERSICGRKLRFPQMTGTSIPMQKSGEHPGQTTATGILIVRTRLITEVMSARVLIWSRPSMKALLRGIWRRTEKRQSAVR